MSLYSAGDMEQVLVLVVVVLYRIAVKTEDRDNKKCLDSKLTRRYFTCNMHVHVAGYAFFLLH